MLSDIATNLALVLLAGWGLSHVIESARKRLHP